MHPGRNSCNLELGLRICSVVGSKGATQVFRDEGDFNHEDDQFVPPRERSLEKRKESVLVVSLGSK